MMRGGIGSMQRRTGRRELEEKGADMEVVVFSVQWMLMDSPDVPE